MIVEDERTVDWSIQKEDIFALLIAKKDFLNDLAIERRSELSTRSIEVLLFEEESLFKYPFRERAETEERRKRSSFFFPSFVPSRRQRYVF